MTPARRLARRAAAAAALAAACACAERVGDTGYVGTWSLGNERVRSTLSIAGTGGEHKARLGLRTADGKREVRCAWDGSCEEIVEGVRTGVWKIALRPDPGTGRLRLETEIREAGAGGEGRRTIDELVVVPGGLAIEAWTVERNGQTFRGDGRPKRVYRKISDRVEDPPR